MSRVIAICLTLALLAVGCLAFAEPQRMTSPIDGSQLVWIPGGEFMMGSTEGDPEERPVARVSVEGFWLGAYEVTNAQYATFMKETNRRAPLYWDDASFNQPNQPAIDISWNDALAYCKWAELRLPTEAEWEYAASAGKQFRYGTATGEIGHDLANYAGTGGGDTWDDVTAPVGSFPPNPFGLYDMAGNAWEWVSSEWKPYPYDPTDGRERLVSYTYRVMRGGCWHFSESYCRATARHRLEAHLHYDYVGFRVALSGDEAKAIQAASSKP
jgi:formylglycine-generating enzyme required for sulfatase activity